MRKLALLCVSTAVALGIAKAVLGFAVTPQRPYGYGDYGYDSALGWSYPTVFRGHANASAPIVFGDSWTWGAFVSPDEAWPALLGWRNAGVSGYGLDQMLLRAEQLKPKAPIYFAVIPSDFTRARLAVAWGLPKPYFRAGDLVGVPVSPFRDRMQASVRGDRRLTNAWLLDRVVALNATLIVYAFDRAPRIEHPGLRVIPIDVPWVYADADRRHPSSVGCKFIAARVREHI